MIKIFVVNNNISDIEDFANNHDGRVKAMSGDMIVVEYCGDNYLSKYNKVNSELSEAKIKLNAIKKYDIEKFRELEINLKNQINSLEEKIKYKNKLIQTMNSMNSTSDVAKYKIERDIEEDIRKEWEGITSDSFSGGR